MKVKGEIKGERGRRKAKPVLFEQSAETSLFVLWNHAKDKGWDHQRFALFIIEIMLVIGYREALIRSFPSEKEEHDLDHAPQGQPI